MTDAPQLPATLSSKQARWSPSRTLPIRIRPGDLEGFDSWIQRYSKAMGLSRMELLRYIGVRDSTKFLVALPERTRRTLSAATGLTDAELVALTLQSFRYTALRTGHSAVNYTLVGQGVHTRICPQCLSDTDGQWQVGWRLAFTFACVRHHSLMVDTCPGGHLIQSTPAQRALHRQNWECGQLTDTAEVCATDLRQLQGEQLHPEHPVVRAQAEIDSILNSGDDDNAVWARFLDIRAIASGVAAENDLDKIREVCDLPASLLQGIDDEAGFGIALAGMESSLMAACATYAVRTLHDLNTTGNSSLLVSPLEYARSFANRATPDAIARRWGKTGPALTAHIRTLLGGTGEDQNRLRYYLADPSRPRPIADDALIRRRIRFLPPIAWPGFAARIPGFPGGPAAAWRSALGDALLIPGSSINDHGSKTREFAPQRWDHNASLLSQLGEQDRTATFRAVYAIADYLDRYGAPIDYSRRRALRIDTALNDNEWSLLGIRRDRPDSLRREQSSAVVWLLITGGHPRAVPPHITANAVNAIPSLRRLLTLKQWRTLHEIALRRLHRFGIIDEPLVWEPPEAVLASVEGLHPAVSDVDALDAAGTIQLSPNRDDNVGRHGRTGLDNIVDRAFFGPALYAAVDTIRSEDGRSMLGV